MAKATIYKLQPTNWDTQCIYSEGVSEYLLMYVFSHLGINSHVNPLTLLLKPGSHTVNISLEKFDHIGSYQSTPLISTDN